MTDKIHNHLLKISAEHCKPLESIIKANGPINIEIPADLELFDCLAQTVVEQQLPTSQQKAFGIRSKLVRNKEKLN